MTGSFSKRPMYCSMVAINIAEYFGVPDLIIGITLVALGTSIPELAVSLRGVFKNQHEMVGWKYHWL